jgi:hypothetical protein
MLQIRELRLGQVKKLVHGQRAWETVGESAVQTLWGQRNLNECRGQFLESTGVGLCDLTPRCGLMAGSAAGS